MWTIVVAWCARLGFAWARQRLDAEARVEMEAHVDLLAERYVRAGMTPGDARDAARRQFGSATLVREDLYEMNGIGWLDGLIRDLRYACRQLRRAPGFTVAVILTLTLGIGASTAIFSVCDAVLFKALPYADPDRIVMLWEQRRHSDTLEFVTPGNFVDWREQSQSFREMAAIDPRPDFVLTGRGEPERLRAAAVSATFFSLFGTQFALGRPFLGEEDRPGRDQVAILSHRTWQRHFGGRGDVLGAPVTLNDVSYTVVGVLPREFELVSRASDFQAQNEFDVWIPLALDPQKLPRNTHPLRVFARLAPDVTLARARADLAGVAANLTRLYPAWNKEQDITVVPLFEHVTTPVQAALGTLLGAVGLVLLIACANVANLLLGRTAARQKEMALRRALGATPRRLARQLLTESLFMALTGGALGLILASTSIRALTPYLPADLPRTSGITLNLRVLLFTGAISILTSLLFGIAPLLQMRRASANDVLKQSRRVAGGAASRMRSGLVVGQMAIAFVLLVGAGLMAKSLWTLLHVSPGFRTEQMLTARVSLSRARYPDARRIAVFQRDLLERVRAVPGVRSAGLTAYLPLSGMDNAWGFVIEGRPPLPIGDYNVSKYRPVSAGYFETIGIPLLQGRAFLAADTGDTAPVVVINASMARHYWGDRNPVGQRIKFGPPAWRTVIGVVGDVRHDGLDAESQAEMYVPFAQAPNNEARTTIVIRTSVDPAAMAADLRGIVSTIDAAVPLDRIETMEQWVSASVGQPRFRTLLLAAFSFFALVLASIGLYGVMSYLVIQRTREFGIRLAIGATGGDILRLVLGRATLLIAAGLGLGMLGSLALARLIASLLYGVTPLDVVTFAAVALLLSAVAVLASYLPARRATRIDPMLALGHE